MAMGRISRPGLLGSSVWLPCFSNLLGRLTEALRQKLNLIRRNLNHVFAAMLNQGLLQQDIALAVDRDLEFVGVHVGADLGAQTGKANG